MPSLRETAARNIRIWGGKNKEDGCHVRTYFCICLKDRKGCLQFLLKGVLHMEQLVFENMEPKKRREDRLREAKMLFSGDSFPASEGFSPFSHEGYEEMPEEFRRKEGHFSFYRPLFAFLLFVLFVTAVHFQISFRGFDRERIEQVLSDDSHYQMLVKQAEAVIRYLEPKGK